MFVKLIYKTLLEDFSFVIDYDYVFLYDVKHHVLPCILLKASQYKIGVGFSYKDHRFFIDIHDFSKKRYSNKETIQKFEPLNPQTEFPFKDGVDEIGNMLE